MKAETEDEAAAARRRRRRARRARRAKAAGGAAEAAPDRALRRAVRRVAREAEARARDTGPHLPERLPRPARPVGRLVIAALGADGFRAFGKQEDPAFWAPFVYALHRHGIEVVATADRETALRAMREGGETALLNLYHEGLGEHGAAAALEADLPEGATVFNRAALGPILASKAATAALYRRAGLPTPAEATGATAEGPTFSIPDGGSQRPATVVEPGGALDPARRNVAYVDTRRDAPGGPCHVMLRINCVGREVVAAYCRARRVGEGSVSVHMKDTPLDPAVVAHFRDTLLAPNMDALRDFARRLGEAFGPGIYSHDVLPEAGTGRLFLAESGFKMSDLSIALRPIQAWLPPGYVPTPAEAARRSAEALIAECRRMGRFEGAADGAELILP